MKRLFFSFLIVLLACSVSSAGPVIMGGGGGGSISSYADVVAVFGSGACSGYLKSNGTCDTPAAAFDPTQPGPIGGTTPAEGSFTKISTGTSDKSWLPTNAIASMDYISPGSGMGAFFFGGVAHYIFFDAVGFLFTDPIGNTSTRIPKGWFTDLEITNLPTVNGGTLANALKASYLATKDVGWAIIDSDTVTAVADGKKAYVVPASLNGMNVIGFTCSVYDLNSAASGNTTVQLRRSRAGTDADVLSSALSIAYNTYTANGSIDTSYDDLATGDLLFVDIDGVTSAAQKGLACTMTAQLP